jgi:hypothetical protein
LVLLEEIAKILIMSLSWLKIVFETKAPIFSLSFIFLVVVVLERGPHTCLTLYYLRHFISPIFVMGILEIGSCELFAQAGFEPRYC